MKPSCKRVPPQGRGGPPRRRTWRNAVVSGPLVAAIGLLLIGCTGTGTVAIPKAPPNPSDREAVATPPPLDLGPWQRYADPFVLVAESNIRFRAVEVDGNIEARTS
jgi:hypothetical protein